ncbi:hypothetical protein [Bdellovibrio sp. HCB288]|uniref:hypothetical protein n=1 Tax=Bdellovibrio sp. HCB288 TaxID=3394355 RepID=UPI0039B5DA88
MKVLWAVCVCFYSSCTFASFGLNPIPEDHLKSNTEVLTVTNMPRTRSQDSLGICYSFVATTILDEAYCVENKIADCTNATDTQKHSVLDSTRYTVKGPSATEYAGEKDNRDYLWGINEGGSPQFVLHRALQNWTVNEACAPFDQLVSKIPDAKKASELEYAMWKTFKDAYKTYQKKSKSCPKCGLEYATAKAEELKRNYGLKTSNQEILEAFSMETYAIFLDRLLIPYESCLDHQLEPLSKWELQQFPTKKKSNYSETISKVKEVLAKKRPIAMSFCTQNELKVKSIKACLELKDKNGNPAGLGHGVVIKGYRKVCKSPGDCYDAVQVQNSWGESWQKANSDGWVDAKVLLDRSFYELGALTWIEKSN